MTEKRDEIRVCVGFPAFHAESYLERLRAVDGVVPIVLPIDADGEWATVNPSEPCAEPPPWAEAVADQRRAALERAHILVALHTPRVLGDLAPQLRWVQGAGAGFEQFQSVGLRADRVQLTNCSGVSAGSMAEWAVGRLLQVWKRFRDADRHQQQHAFVRTYGRTFAGATIGIVGLGHIGRALSHRLRPFGCRVLGLRRSARPGDTSPDVDQLFGPDQLHEMLGMCDAVVIAAPASPETHHLIDEKALAAIPAHAVLVNIARGSLVDEAALAEAMRRGDLGAAVLDVFDQEPLPPESPLWDIPNVYISAHSSVSIDRYIDDVFDLFLDNLQRWVAGEPLRNVVDLGDSVTD